jgi:hypothetical protein
MSFQPFSVSLVCEGARIERIREDQVLKIQIKIFIPLIDFISAHNLSFSSKLPRFSRNFIIRANLAENSNSFVFEMISGFCSSLRVDSN